ncbi:MAG: hypothetical protein V2A62_03215 [Candidatus Woesearchaeota archaeon]
MQPKQMKCLGEEEEEHFYSKEKRAKMLDGDELTQEEEGFMKGYDEDTLGEEEENYCKLDLTGSNGKT